MKKTFGLNFEMLDVLGWLLWRCCRGGERRYLLFSECLTKSLSPSPSPSIFCVLSIFTLPSISLSLYIFSFLFLSPLPSFSLSLSFWETPVEYSHQHDFFPTLWKRQTLTNMYSAVLWLCLSHNKKQHENITSASASRS